MEIAPNFFGVRYNVYKKGLFGRRRIKCTSYLFNGSEMCHGGTCIAFCVDNMIIVADKIQYYPTISIPSSSSYENLDFCRCFIFVPILCIVLLKICYKYS